MGDASIGLDLPQEAWNDPALLGGLPQGGTRENHWTGVRNLWDFGNYKEMESAALEVFISLKGAVTQFWGHSGSSCPVQDVHPLVGNLPPCQRGRAEILGVCECDSCRFRRKTSHWRGAGGSSC